MKTRRIPVLLAALWLAGCGTPAAKTTDAGPLIDTPQIVDAGITPSCPSGFTLNSAIDLSFKGTTFEDGCWQATVGDSPLLTVHGLPTYPLGLMQFSIQFNATDSNDATCSYAADQTIPLTSSCILIEGSNLGSGDWSIFANAEGSAGSLTINQWPSASGQPLSITFSNDAAVVVTAQSGGMTVSPFTGSFTTTAN